jgi:hypothetical protein
LYSALLGSSDAAVAAHACTNRKHTAHAPRQAQ